MRIQYSASENSVEVLNYPQAAHAVTLIVQINRRKPWLPCLQTAGGQQRHA